MPICTRSTCEAWKSAALQWHKESPHGRAGELHRKGKSGCGEYTTARFSFATPTPKAGAQRFCNRVPSFFGTEKDFLRGCSPGQKKSGFIRAGFTRGVLKTFRKLPCACRVKKT